MLTPTALPVVNLASAQDVKNVLQRELTTAENTAVTGALAKASQIFRRESLQHFTPASSSVRLKVEPSSKTSSEMQAFGRRTRLDRLGLVYLRQSPVVAVTSVTDDYGDAVTYDRVDNWLFIDGLGASDFVRVTYTHGHDTVPADVVQTIAEMVARSLPVSEGVRTGLTSEMEVTGPFTTQRQYAAWAVGGTVALSPDERTFAQSFRKRKPKLWVQRP